MAKAAIFLADGFEEIEALTVVDLLRRAEIEIKMVSITGILKVTGSHKITIEADTLLQQIDFHDFSILILPGGMPGTRHLDACDALKAPLKEFAADKSRYVAAICAGPSVLGHLGILKGRHACCYPGFESELTDAVVDMDGVVKDGNIITARGMGKALLFGLTIIEALKGKQEAEKIASSVVA